MEFTKSDLLKLLTVMEGELQAREVAIAVLKAEQTKQLLYPGHRDNNSKMRMLKSASSPAPAKATGTATMIPNRGKGQLSVKGLPFSNNNNSSSNQNDPMAALMRDGSMAFDPNFEDSMSKALLGIQLKQLQIMTEKEKQVRKYLKNQLEEVNDKYNKVFKELETEKSRAEYFDREKCLKQVESLESQVETLKSSVDTLTKQIESEKEREKKMILCLLAERKQLIVKLIEEKSRSNELLQIINGNKVKISEMIEGLEEESKRSLLMELDLEKLQAEFKKEKQGYIDKVHMSESRCQSMAAEIDRLRKELEGIKPGSSAAIPSASIYRNIVAATNPESASTQQIGEGVRSSIVTVNSASSGHHRIVPNVSSVMPVNSPKANIAISPNTTISSNNSSSKTMVTSLPSSGASPVTISGTKSNFNTIKASPKTMLLSNVTTFSTVPVSASPSVSVVDSSMAKAGVVPTTISKMPHEEEPPPVPSSQPPTKLPESIGVPIYQSQLRSAADSHHLTSSKSVDVATTPMTVTKAPLIKRLSSSGSSSSTGSPRGTPPPVPPNKPILPAQILKERSKLIQATVSKSMSVTSSSTTTSSSSSSTSNVVEGEIVNGVGKSVIVSQSKVSESQSKSMELLKSFSTSSSTLPGEGATMNNNNHDESSSQVMHQSSSVSSSSSSSNNVDLICQELADFQKLLVSMVHNK